MAKKATKPVAKEAIVQPVEKPVEKPLETKIFYVQGYGNVIATTKEEAEKKAKAIIARIRG